MSHHPLMVRGAAIYTGFLSAQDQHALLADIRSVVAAAPLCRPTTPSGKAMSVQMTSAGRFGWISDRKGYRYAPCHPDGAPWPPIPESVLAIWRALIGAERMPECCLINFYDQTARMGLHQDRDEADFSWPVLSVSLGDDALFRLGGEARGDKTESIWLRSGDVVVLGGAARRIFHGVDRIRPGSSRLLSRGGRINLTLRVVT